MLKAKQRRSHSTVTLYFPRVRKRRKRISSLVMAKVPSVWIERLTRSRQPSSEEIRCSIFIPLAEEIFVHIEGLSSLLQRLFAVAFADTFFFTRTTAAVFTAVNRSFAQESRLRFLLFYLCQHEMLSLCANIFVRFGKICHILPPTWVSTVFLSLFLLMIGWFDIGIGVL